MRISDWISDVCSSDLGLGDKRNGAAGARIHLNQINFVFLDRELHIHQATHFKRYRKFMGLTFDFIYHFVAKAIRRQGAGADRQSVVKGKRESVRVALGGRRIMQNKTYNTPNQI